MWILLIRGGQSLRVFMNGAVLDFGDSGIALSSFGLPWILLIRGHPFYWFGGLSIAGLCLGKGLDFTDSRIALCRSIRLPFNSADAGPSVLLIGGLSSWSFFREGLGFYWFENCTASIQMVDSGPSVLLIRGAQSLTVLLCFGAGSCGFCWFGGLSRSGCIWTGGSCIFVIRGFSGCFEFCWFGAIRSMDSGGSVAGLSLLIRKSIRSPFILLIRGLLFYWFGGLSRSLSFFLLWRFHVDSVDSGGSVAQGLYERGGLGFWRFGDCIVFFRVALNFVDSGPSVLLIRGAQYSWSLFREGLGFYRFENCIVSIHSASFQFCWCGAFCSTDRGAQ